MIMKGIDGLVVAVAAIVATVLIGGTVGALTPVTVETTDYDYATNINAMYMMEDVPVPSEYSPAGNWNAWRASDTGTPTSGITYETLNRYNGIPVLVEPEVKQTSRELSSTLSLDYAPFFYTDSSTGTQYTPQYRTSLYTAVTYVQMSILPITGYTKWIIDTADLGVAVTSEIDSFTIPTTGVTTYRWEGQKPDHVIYDQTNGSVALVNSLNETYRSLDASDVMILWGVAPSGSTGFGSTMEIMSMMNVTPTYIDTTKGIGLSGSRAFWSNDYDNASMRWVFRSSDDAAMRLWFTLTEPKTGDPLGVGTTMIMDASVEDGRYSVSYRVYTQTGLNLATGTIDLGVWPGMVVDVDLYNGELRASGVSVFRDFRNYTESGYTESADLGISGAAVRRIVADNTTPTMMFGIDRTSIYLTASETVMINPQVDIPESFPALADAYQIRYDSFAIWGDSITINGRTYAVNNRTLTQAPYLYNGELTYIDVPLTSLRITVSNGETTLEYSTGAEYSEPTTSTVVSFNGAWFFDSDLYEVTTGTATEYEFSGGFALDWDGSIVIYIIMLAAGSAVITKYRNPGLMDWAIVAFALAAGWVML